MRMSHIAPVLMVKSVYRAVDWYGAVLDMQPAYLNEEPGEEDSLNYAVLRSGSVTLHLGKEGDLSEDLQARAGHGGCEINVLDYDAYRQRAVEQGERISHEGKNPVGQRNFMLRDPDGNTLVITEARASIAHRPDSAGRFPVS